MPAPPLWTESLALSDAVIAIADNAGFDLAMRRACLEVLAEVIASGETSHVRAVRRVAEAIENDRPRLEAIAARHRASTTPAHSPRIGAKSVPQPEQAELRWDLQE